MCRVTNPIISSQYRYIHNQMQIYRELGLSFAIYRLSQGIIIIIYFISSINLFIVKLWQIYNIKSLPDHLEAPQAKGIRPREGVFLINILGWLVLNDETAICLLITR